MASVVALALTNIFLSLSPSLSRSSRTMTTTPNEFLQFAHGMRLEHEQSLLHASAGTVDGNPANGYSLTGLAVLNNLCHLIEQIHTLKAENGRLRAHLDLMNHVEGFLLKSEANNRMARERDTKYLRSATSLLIGSGACDEEKSFTLSPTNSLRIKKRDSPTLSMLSRDRSGTRPRGPPPLDRTARSPT